jgi:hypothetical protein
MIYYIFVEGSAQILFEIIYWIPKCGVLVSCVVNLFFLVIEDCLVILS